MKDFMTKIRKLIITNKRMVCCTSFAVVLVAGSIAGLIFLMGDKEEKGHGTNGYNKTNISKNQETTETMESSETNGISTSEESEESEEETTTQAVINEEETSEYKNYVPVDLKYYIKVNRVANCITVYGKDEAGNYTVPVKAITCSVARDVVGTPLGTYSISYKHPWLFMVDKSYGQYAMRFYGSYWFHSVTYYTKDKGDLEWEQFNKLGEPASLGCVRINVADAIWLTDNCPAGTKVEIYDDADNPGPLGKPDTIKIPADSPYRGWDPTDPDPDNPWHRFSPRIEVKETTVTVNINSSEADFLRLIGAKGYDTCTNDVTGKIQVTGFDTSTQQKINVTLSLKDAIGKNAENVIIEVDVVDNRETAPETEVSEADTESTESTETDTEETDTAEINTGESETSETNSEETDSEEEETTTVDTNNS